MTSSAATASVTGWVGLVCVLVCLTYSTLVSYYKVSVATTLACSPVVALLCYIVIRGIRGNPRTFNVNLHSKSKIYDWLDKNNKNKRFHLVGMPVSHFVEKTRWVLDLAQAPYDETTAGGILTMMFRARSVPWLADRQACSHIGNSDEIVSYVGALVIPALEEAKDALSTAASTTEASALAQRISRLRQFFHRDAATLSWDRDLNAFGHAVQGWAYFYHLAEGNHGMVTKMAWGGYENGTVSAVDRWLVLGLYPLFKVVLRDGFKLHSQEVCAKRLAVIKSVLDRADAALERNAKELAASRKHVTGAGVEAAAEDSVFLMGAYMSHVDVAFCSLVAPLVAFAVLHASPGSPESLYAAGRFKSFVLTTEAESLHGAPLGTDALFRRTTPGPIAEMERDILSRPCGRYLMRMYKEHRKAPL